MIIEDGTGSGNKVKIDSDNRLHTQTISFSEYEQAAIDGRAFNVNTGLVSYSGTGENAMLYLQNNEDKDIFLQAFFVGVATRGATVTDAATVQVVRNPTGGTIVDNAQSIELVNRNFGSNETFDITAYKGADGYTLTGGDTSPVLLHIQGDNSRVFGEVFLVLPKGSSVGIKIDLNTSGSANVYCGFTGFRKK